MGYQALLFCPDEKIARVVTQVFTELDFRVEPVNEPFAAVKKLMAQRFDAIVVDCDHEQNATLLFKSARNSGSNQNSLAFALVEGQTGVAKAYRMGANLVLTKPINMEQAKGTLRVARGLLRKNSDAAAPTAVSAASVAAPAKPAYAPAASSPKPPSRMAEPIPPASNKYETPEFEPALPAMAASAKPEKSTVVAPPPQVQSKVPVEVAPVSSGQHPDFSPEASKPAISAPALPIRKPAASLGSAQGTAAAPAPARETVPSENKTPFSEPREITPARAHSVAPIAVPTFSALDESEGSEGAGGSKKILAIAAVVVVAAALGYFGWTKFGETNASQTQTVALQPASAQPSAVAPSANTPESVNPATKPSSTASSTPQPGKPSALAGTAPPIKIAADPEPLIKKAEATPIRVKSEPGGSRVQKPSDEPAQVPNPLGLASSNDQSISKLVASAPAAMPKANLGTLRISQGVAQGMVIKRVQPVYPRSAMTMHVQGTVQLEAIISKEGAITNLKVLKGDAVLGRAAMDAVRQWRYKPYYLDGLPVEIDTQITVNFKLPD